MPSRRGCLALEGVNSAGILHNDDVSTLLNDLANNTVDAIILSRCVNAELVHPVLEELQFYPSIEYLKLYGNRDMRTFSTLEQARRIRNLVFEGRREQQDNTEGLHDFGSAGATVLAEFLTTNTTMKHLVLSGNRIGPSGAVALARALQVNRTLEALDLREPIMGADGFKAISDALKVNKTVTSLTVAIGKGFDDAAKSFEEAMRLNSTIKSLTLIRWGDRVDLQRFNQPVHQILKWNVTLLQMNCSLSDPEVTRRALSENRNMDRFLGASMTEAVLPYALSKSKRPVMVYHILQKHVDMAVRGLL